MNPSILAFSAVAAAVFSAAGCGRDRSAGEGDDPSVSGAPAPAQAGAVSPTWSSANIARDPDGYIADTLAKVDALCDRLRELESNLQAQLQSANREISSLKARETEARLFWRAAKPVFDNPATVYPAVASGRRFGSRDALMRELVEANRTVSFATNALSKIENNAANVSAALSKASADLARASARRQAVARKADAIKSAAAAKDLKELSSLCSSLFADADAALPDEDLFAPSADFLGDDGGESELEGVSL